MNNQDFYKAARGYWTANALTGSVASELASLNRQEAARIAETNRFYSHYLTEKQLGDKVGHYILLGNVNQAYEFLNESLKREIVHDCQNQKRFEDHLSEMINQRIEKYRPFYQKINMSIPAKIEEMTAEEICSIMSVDLLTPEQLRKYHSDKEAEERADKIFENLGLAFRAVLIIGLIILMMYLSAQ